MNDATPDRTASGWTSMKPRLKRGLFNIGRYSLVPFILFGVPYVWGSFDQWTGAIDRIFADTRTRCGAAYQGCPLHVSVRNDSPAGVRAALVAGADIAARDERGLNALDLAAELGAVEIVKMLLDAGAVIDASNKRGITALDRAALKCSAKAIKVLLDAGASTGKAENVRPINLAGLSGAEAANARPPQNARVASCAESAAILAAYEAWR